MPEGDMIFQATSLADPLKIKALRGDQATFGRQTGDVEATKRRREET
jgi:hypothetical protein